MKQVELVTSVLGGAVCRGPLRMDPEYEVIWFFVNNQEKASPVEEALKKQVQKLACSLYFNLASFSRHSNGAQWAWRQRRRLHVASATCISPHQG